MSLIGKRVLVPPNPDLNGFSNEPHNTWVKGTIILQKKYHDPDSVYIKYDDEVHLPWYFHKDRGSYLIIDNHIGNCICNNTELRF